MENGKSFYIGPGKIYSRNNQIDTDKVVNNEDDITTWLAHLVSQFACNRRAIVDASSIPPVSNPPCQIAVTKT